MLDLDKYRPRPAGGQGDCRRCRGDVAATSGDVAETLPQLGESASLFHVRLFQSPAGLGDISVKSPSVAATSIAETNFVRDWGDVSKTCWRPRRLPKMSQRHRHDCRRCCGDVAVTARDVSETLPQLRRRLGDVAEMSPRLPGELVVTLSRDVSKTSPWWEHKSFSWSRAHSLFLLFQSPAGLGDISANSPSVAATSLAETNFIRDWGDVSETCWIETKETAKDVAKTSPRLPEMLRRRRRNWEDVSEMSRRCRRDFRVNWLSLCLETSLRHLLGESASLSHVRLRYFFFTFPVSSRSRRHLREISISCGDVDHGD